MSLFRGLQDGDDEMGKGWTHSIPSQGTEALAEDKMANACVQWGDKEQGEYTSYKPNGGPQKMEVDWSCPQDGKQQSSSVALTWAPDGKRKRGRPRETWRRTDSGEGEWSNGAHVMEGGRHCSIWQSSLEETHSWPYSLRGETGIRRRRWRTRWAW